MRDTHSNRDDRRMDIKTVAVSLAAFCLFGTFAAQAQADELVQNGGFEAVQGGLWGTPTTVSMAAYGTAALWAPNGGPYEQAAAAGWSYSPEGLGGIFAADGLTNSAKYGLYGYYGPSQNYGASYLQYSLGASPAGGNFVGLDGDEYAGALSQTINGLTPGQAYTLTFYQAADHYQGWGDVQGSQFAVSLGAVTQYSPAMSVTSGSTGWQKVTMSFTASAASEVLSFTNAGSGAPPFALLDGVSLKAASLGPGGVPEPATWALMLVGVGAVGASARAQRARKPAVA